MLDLWLMAEKTNSEGAGASNRKPRRRFSGRLTPNLDFRLGPLGHTLPSFLDGVKSVVTGTVEGTSLILPPQWSLSVSASHTLQPASGPRL